MQFNAECVIDVIMLYLPPFKYKLLSNKPASIDSLKEENDRSDTNIIIYNALFHSNVSWIFNNGKAPCKTWHNSNLQYKFLLCGLQGVGKRSLIMNLTENVNANKSLTSYSKQCILNPKQYINDISSTKDHDQAIVDYSNLARFECSLPNNFLIRPTEYAAILVCFAVNDEHTFSMAKTLIQSIYSHWDSNNKDSHDTLNGCPILVATKCDLNAERKVTTEMALDLAKKWSIPYFETSAKDDINVKFMFISSVYEYWIHSQLNICLS